MTIFRSVSLKEFLLSVRSYSSAGKNPAGLPSGARKNSIPHLLFRGEPQDYVSTVPSIDRRLLIRGIDTPVARDLVWHYTLQLAQCVSRDHDIELDDALGFIQHYGGLTPILDFTGDAHVALAFAVDSESQREGFVAVMPTNRPTHFARVIDYGGLKVFLERPRRQRAFGLTADDKDGPAFDLKDNKVSTELGIHWFHIRFRPEEAARYYRQKLRLTATKNDPYAGVLRNEIMKFVIRTGKLDDATARLFATRVPHAPVMGRVRMIRGEVATINLMAAKMGPKAFDLRFEQVMSYLKWSDAYPTVTPVGIYPVLRRATGKLMAFPDTFHSWDENHSNAWTESGRPCL